MKRILIIVATLAALSLTGGCPAPEPEPVTKPATEPTTQSAIPPATEVAPQAENGASIRWLTSMDAALKEAKRTKKPIMIDFYATWCGPCKVLDEQVYTEKQVIEQSQKWIAVRVDVDKDQKTALKYGVVSMPTVVLAKSDGTVVKWFSGVLKPASMVEFMQSSLAKARAA